MALAPTHGLSRIWALSRDLAGAGSAAGDRFGLSPRNTGFSPRKTSGISRKKSGTSRKKSGKKYWFSPSANSYEARHSSLFLQTFLCRSMHVPPPPDPARPSPGPIPARPPSRPGLPGLLRPAWSSTFSLSTVFFPGHTGFPPRLRKRGRPPALPLLP